MFAAAIEGLDEARGRLDGLPAELETALSAKAAELSAALADRLRNDKIRGAALNVRSGAVKDSVLSEVSPTGDGAFAVAGSSGDIKNSAIREYDGKTAARETLQAKAQAFAFVTGGAQRFAPTIEQPGSHMLEGSRLSSALEEMGDEIVSYAADAAAQAWINS